VTIVNDEPRRDSAIREDPRMFLVHRPSDMATPPAWRAERVVLVGDAAHGIQVARHHKVL
jgi:2-polyprenyl-6-methoxyphenol hydroxylase-like FAD-dependent oxidoreductase